MPGSRWRRSRRSRPASRASSSGCCSTSTTAGCGSLPLPCLAAAAYARAAAAGEDAEAAGRRAWESEWNRGREDAEPEHVLAFGSVLTFAELCGQPPRANQSFEADDPSRFGRYARRLWSGLRAHEHLVESLVTAAFDVCGPLPTGVTVLEASAGTGKTSTIAGLAARYVADGVPLQALLLVTFTRMATGELRERVRDRLVSAEAGLARALAGVAPEAGDAVLALLATGDEATVGARRDRLARALADFDAATIATTHGFCQEVLAGLGVAGDLEEGATVVEAIDDLIEEVVDDLYVQWFQASGDPQFGAPRRWRSRAWPSRTRRRRSSRPPPRSARRRGCASSWRTRSAPSSRRASAAPASSPTTTS